MNWKHPTCGALFGGTVSVAACTYGWHKFTDEPEFGSIIGSFAAILGIALGLVIFALSAITGFMSHRRKARKESD